MGIKIYIHLKDQEPLELKIRANKEYTIGRSSSADITIEDDFISSIHCSFYFDDTKVIVKDLGSTNGTSIDQNTIFDSFFYLEEELMIGDTIIKIKEESLHPELKRMLTKKEETKILSLHDDIRAPKEQESNISIMKQRRLRGERTTVEIIKPNFKDVA